MNRYQWRTQELLSWGAKFKGVFCLLVYNTYLVRFGSGRKIYLPTLLAKPLTGADPRIYSNIVGFFWMLNFI
ncbi:hypothetical protein Hanom_Chr02g00121351 [Helianthus anomalus]